MSNEVSGELGKATNLVKVSEVSPEQETQYSQLLTEIKRALFLDKALTMEYRKVDRDPGYKRFIALHAPKAGSDDEVDICVSMGQGSRTNDAGFRLVQLLQGKTGENSEREVTLTYFKKGVPEIGRMNISDSTDPTCTSQLKAKPGAELIKRWGKGGAQLTMGDVLFALTESHISNLSNEDHGMLLRALQRAKIDEKMTKRIVSDEVRMSGGRLIKSNEAPQNLGFPQLQQSSPR